MVTAATALPSEPFSVPEAEVEQIQRLRRMLESGEAYLESPAGERIPVPADVHALFVRILELLQKRQAIAIIPYMQELTTKQAADLLGFSRQFLVRLLQEDKLPFHFAGTHRRLYLKDVLSFKETRDHARREALKDLARRDVESGVYDTVVLPDE
jgi:excisionase family DNA binding protein